MSTPVGTGVLCCVRTEGLAAPTTRYNSALEQIVIAVQRMIEIQAGRSSLKWEAKEYI